VPSQRRVTIADQARGTQKHHAWNYGAMGDQQRRHQPAPPPEGLASDPRWNRAGQWLSDGPGDREPGLTVIGVPASKTSLSPTGAHTTPQAIRDALWRYSTFAASRGVDVATLAPLDAGDLPDPDADEGATLSAVAELTKGGALCVALGGDNSITYAVASGVFGADLSHGGLVTLDAHHDLRDGVSNGSPVRRLIEAGLPPSNIVQIGIADFANSHAYSMRASEYGIRVMTLDDVRRRGMTAVMRDALEIAGRGGAGIHVDLDVDVCDRSVAPGCPASVPGGLPAHDLREAAFVAGLHASVRSADIVEIDATADAPDQRTIRLGALCLLELAAGLARRSGALR